jgi:methylenetetrahydrofolate reductase (NADPH)
LTAELPPIPDTDAFLARARHLSQHVDAIQVTESPGLRALGSPLLSALLLRQAGMEPVLHMNCRNRNRIALQGELLGAATAGVSALLLTRSVPARVGRTARKHVVFDLRAKELVAAARRIRDADPPARFGLAKSPEFFIGTTATVFEAGSDWKPQSLLGKLDSGAQWLQTQLCMDMPLLRTYMRRFVSEHLTHRCHFVVTVALLQSVEAARRVRRQLRSAQIPRALVRRLEQTTDSERAGVEICAETLRELADIPGVSGAHIVVPGATPELVRAVVEASGLRRPSG